MAGGFFLLETESVPGLGINDKKLQELVLHPDLLEEIQLLRGANGC